jgi:hypothetical protein
MTINYIWHSMNGRRVLRSGVFVFIAMMLFAISADMFAAVSVSPKYIFLDPSRRSVAITVSNPDPEDLECWVDFKYGYVASDDTGKLQIVYDSIATNEPSAASWLKSYPQRFIVGPNETQIVRVTASPPPGLLPGEYWARVLISGKPRSTPKPSNNLGGVSMGVGWVRQIGLAFHYRIGKVSTGIEVTNFNVAATSKKIDAKMFLQRTGNASYWGTRFYRLLDANRNVIGNWRRHTAVYKTMWIHDVFDLPVNASGSCTLEAEFVTEKRTDLNNADLVKSPAVRVSSNVVIPTK